MADLDRRLRTIVIGYLCEPGRGSERGAGWGMLQGLLQFSDCTLICGPESGPRIRRWMSSHPTASLDLVVVSEPLWAPAFKRNRIGEFLTYLAWQRRARRVGRELASRRHFDVAFHATLSAFWLPSVATDLGLPSVWGPVGGAVTTPTALWPLLGWRGVGVELVDWIAVRVMSLLRSTRRTWHSADVRIVQNAQTLQRLPSDLRAETVVMNHAEFHRVSVSDGVEAPARSGGYVAWVSPMESRKGPELAVRALAETPNDTKMIMAGDGPERPRIEALARSVGVADRIDFVGLVPHPEALAIIRDADVAMFTGMREEGGLALAEAMLFGTPVVVLANGGADALARAATDPQRVERVQPRGMARTVASMAAALETQLERGRTEPGQVRSPLIDQKDAVEKLQELVLRAVSRGGG